MLFITLCLWISTLLHDNTAQEDVHVQCITSVFFFHTGTVMVNKDTIEVVETAFQHFHKFLDTLSLTSKDTSVLHTGH